MNGAAFGNGAVSCCLSTGDVVYLTSDAKISVPSHIRTDVLNVPLMSRKLYSDIILKLVRKHDIRIRLSRNSSKLMLKKSNVVEASDHQMASARDEISTHFQANSAFF
jgi:hypothetical protein